MTKNFVGQRALDVLQEGQGNSLKWVQWGGGHQGEPGPLLSSLICWWILESERHVFSRTAEDAHKCSIWTTFLRNTCHFRPAATCRETTSSICLPVRNDLSFVFRRLKDGMCGGAPSKIQRQPRAFNEIRLFLSLQRMTL